MGGATLLKYDFLISEIRFLVSLVGHQYGVISDGLSCALGFVPRLGSAFHNKKINWTVGAWHFGL